LSEPDHCRFGCKNAIKAIFSGDQREENRIWRDTGASHISAPAFVPHLIGDGWKTPEFS
jgi:hypothetical protein